MIKYVLKPGAAMLLAVISALGTAWAQAAKSTTLSDPTFTPVLSQTISGVTVKITQARWDVPKTTSSVFSTRDFLRVRYMVTQDPLLPLPAGTDLASQIKTITAVDETGFRYDAFASADRSGSAGGGQASWSDIDPRWNGVALDFEFLDPAATPLQAGAYAGPVSIPNIPVPSMPDADMPVDLEATTPLGTQVIVEKVRVQTLPGAHGAKTFFTVHIVPAAAASDLRFSFSTGTKVTDDTGADISGNGSGTGGDGLQIVGIAGVPNPGAKSLTLTLDVREQSESLRRQRAYRHFHLLLPLQAVKPARRHASPPLATVQGRSVIGSVDSLGAQYGSYRARLVLHDRQDPAVIWRVRSLHARTEAGTELRSAGGTEYFYWKADCTPLALGEEGEELLLNTTGNYDGTLEDPPPPAKTLTLTAEVEAYRAHSHVLDFLSLPAPVPGRTITVNRRVQDVTGAYLVVRKIAAYSPAHPLPPGITSSRRLRLAPPASSGLAVVIAEPPASHGSGDFDFAFVSASTPAGDSLLPARTRSSSSGDAVSGGSPPPGDPARITTFYLTTPEAQTFDLRLYREETTRLNEREALTFQDIPASPAPGKP